MASKRKLAFELFAQGFPPTSPEVKALGLTSKSRSNYYMEFKNETGATYGNEKQTTVPSSGAKSQLPGNEGIETPVEEKPAAIDLVEALTNGPEIPVDDQGGEEGVAAQGNKVANEEDEVADEEGTKEEEVATEESKVAKETIEASDQTKPTKKEEKPAPRKFAPTIAESGIKVSIYLSIQSLSYYKMAAQYHLAQTGGVEGPLVLGDFCDTCIQDYFVGRDQELGIVRKGNGKGPVEGETKSDKDKLAALTELLKSFSPQEKK